MIKTVTRIVHKRLKDVATKWVLTAEKESKCICGRGSTLDTLGELTALPTPQTPYSWIWEGEMTEVGRGGKWLKKRKVGE